MTTYPVQRRWSRQEYDRLVELGVLHEDEPIELIGGQMVVAEPKGSPWDGSCVRARRLPSMTNPNRRPT